MRRDTILGKSSRGAKAWIALMACLFLATSLLSAQTVFVDPENGDDNNDGSSWSSAKATIQAGVDAATEGGPVYLKSGVYQPESLIGADLAEYTAPSGVHPRIFGGFLGSETSHTERTYPYPLTLIDMQGREGSVGFSGVGQTETRRPEVYNVAVANADIGFDGVALVVGGTTYNSTVGFNNPVSLQWPTAVGGQRGIVEGIHVLYATLVGQSEVALDVSRLPVLGSVPIGDPRVANAINLQQNLFGFAASGADALIRSHPDIAISRGNLFLFDSAPLFESYDCNDSGFYEVFDTWFRPGSSPAAVCGGSTIANDIDEIGGDPANLIGTPSFGFDQAPTVTVVAVDNSPEVGTLVTLSDEIDIEPFLIGLLQDTIDQSVFHMVIEQSAADQFLVMTSHGLAVGDSLRLFDIRPLPSADFVGGGLADAGHAQPDVERPEVIAVNDSIPYVLDFEFSMPIDYGMLETRFDQFQIRIAGTGSGVGQYITTQVSDTEIRLEWPLNSSFNTREYYVDYSNTTPDGIRGLGRFYTGEVGQRHTDYQILNATIIRSSPAQVLVQQNRPVPTGSTFRLEGSGVSGSPLDSPSIVNPWSRLLQWNGATILPEGDVYFVVEHASLPGGELRFDARQKVVAYVDAESGSDLNDGTSWENARATVQAGSLLNYWADELWVTAGRYELTPLNIRFEIDAFQDVLGGFEGGETSSDQRPSDTGYSIVENNSGISVTIDRNGPWELQRHIERFAAVGGATGFGTSVLPIDSIALGNTTGFRSALVYESQAYNNQVAYRQPVRMFNSIGAFSTSTPLMPGSSTFIPTRYSHNILGPTVAAEAEVDFEELSQVIDLPINIPPRNETSYTFANNAYFGLSPDVPSTYRSSSDQFSNRPASGELVAFSSQAQRGVWTDVIVDEEDRSTTLVAAPGTFQPNELRGRVILHDETSPKVSLVLDNDADSVTVLGVLADAAIGQDWRVLDFRPLQNSQLVNTGRPLLDNYLDRLGVEREVESPREVGPYELNCQGPILVEIVPSAGVEILATFSADVDPDALGNPENYRVRQFGSGGFTLTPTQADIIAPNQVVVRWETPEMIGGASVELEARLMYPLDPASCLGAPASWLATGAAAQPPTLDGIAIVGPLAIDVLFSKPMASMVDDETRYDLSGSGRGTLSSRPYAANRIAPNVVRLSWISGEMNPGGEVSITVASNATDTFGNLLADPRLASTMVPNDLETLLTSSLLFNDVVSRQWVTARNGSDLTDPEVISTLPIRHDALSNEAILPGRFFGGDLTDLAYVSSSGNLRLVRNLGNEQFDSPVLAGAGLTYAPLEGYDLFAADVTGDGYVDIVEVDPVGEIRVLSSPGSAIDASASPVAFGAFPRDSYDWFAFGDVDGDGRADLVMLDNDDSGRVDVIFANDEGFNSDPVVWGGTGFRHSPDVDGWAVLLGDFTGDMRADIACVTQFGDVWVSTSGLGHYQPPTRWGWLGYHDTPDTGWSVLTGDWSRNGVADLIQLTEFGDIWVSESTTNGFTIPVRRVWAGFENHPLGPTRTFSGNFVE